MVRLMTRAAAIALLLSACSTELQPSGSEPAAGTAGGAAGVSAEPVATEPVGSEPAETGACEPPVLCGDVLAPGDYSAATATTEMTFTVDEGWSGTEYEDLGFDLVRTADGELQLLSAVPYSGVVYADVCSGAATQEIGVTAADFVAFIADRPGIAPKADATEVTVGERSGMQIDVDATEPGCESDPPERLWLWELEGVSDFHLNVGEAARLIALDGDAGVTVVVIEASDPGDFESLLDAAQPVLESMTFD